MGIGVIIFDMMGVLFIDKHIVKNNLIPMLKKKGAFSYSIVKDFYFKYVIGKISHDKFWNKIKLKDYNSFEKEYLDSFTLDPEINILTNLKKFYKLAILSNMPKEWADYLIKKENFKHFFDNIFISGEIGLRKPDKEIFMYVLEKLNVQANECLFVDDKLKNLKIASSVGIKTVWYDKGEIDDQFKPNFTITNLIQLNQII